MWLFISRENISLRNSARLKGPSRYEEFLQSLSLLWRELGTENIVYVSLVVIVADIQE